MNWHSIGDFLHMGGYALYVWGSFAMCALVIGIECAGPPRAAARCASSRWTTWTKGRCIMKPRTRRGLAIAAGLATLSVAALLVLNAFQSNLVFFFSLSQIVADEAPRDRAFRIGGLVEEGSIRREPQS